MPKYNKGKDKTMSIDQFIDDENQTLTPKEKYIITGLENKVAERDKVIRQLNQQVEQLQTALRKSAFNTALDMGNMKIKDYNDEIEYFNMLHNRGCYIRL